MPHQPSATDTTTAEAPTDVYAHNLLLRKGPNFRVYIPWMRGTMVRTDPGRTPSFDNASSFGLHVEKGIMEVRLEDLAHYLNASAVPHARLTRISLSARGGQIHLLGTAHKLLPIPVEIVGTISAEQATVIRLHVLKVSMLKLPITGLLSGFHLTLADLLQSNQPGIRVAGNDILFNTDVIFPSPHITGPITSLRLATDKHGAYLEAVYGDTHADPALAQKWHNFLQLTNGTLDFGKLTMHHVDLIMIDASNASWFDLDLINYQAQLVNGITRMTPQAGLQIFMPNVSALPPSKPGETITMEWLRDRTLPPPPEIPFH
ncbi:hypothetical protein D1Y84_09740 [Acidipila sp. EB88]|nr:hypothetical protein D1Y84_09740 [Acidipila sp. EB88]